MNVALCSSIVQLHVDKTPLMAPFTTSLLAFAAAATVAAAATTSETTRTMPFLPGHLEHPATRLCRPCPAGERALTECTAARETECIPCQPGTYTDRPNTLHRCLLCRRPCAGLEREESSCEAASPRRCVCKPGAYLVDERCHQHRECPPGYGVHRRGTNETDVECKRCLSNYFSLEVPGKDGAARFCRRHTNCRERGLKVLRFGTGKDDTVCAKNVTMTRGGPTRTSLLMPPPTKPGGPYDKPRDDAMPWYHAYGHVAIVICPAIVIVLAIVIVVLIGVVVWQRRCLRKMKLQKLCNSDSPVTHWLMATKKEGDKVYVLNDVALKIGTDWSQLLGQLGISDWAVFQQQHPHSIHKQALSALEHWAHKDRHRCRGCNEQRNSRSGKTSDNSKQKTSTLPSRKGKQALQHPDST
ncbi:unnamed protein product [Lampetra planeri]